jgi:hypothetical protein
MNHQRLRFPGHKAFQLPQSLADISEQALEIEPHGGRDHIILKDFLNPISLVVQLFPFSIDQQPIHDDPSLHLASRLGRRCIFLTPLQARLATSEIFIGLKLARIHQIFIVE